MKRKRTSLKSSYLPDECWESIFKFIIDGNNNNRRYLYPLSAVSTQFLSIIDPLRLSLTVLDPAGPHGLFKRFTNLNSLNLSRYHGDLDDLLCKISCFPLKLTSLNLSNQPAIPTNGLRAFSKKIMTLTSLTCSRISFNSTDFFLIAECFPLLEELDLSNCMCYWNIPSYHDGIETLSLELTKLRKVNLSYHPIDNQSFILLLKNCKFLEEAIIFSCTELTNEGIVSALRERPTLSSLSFSKYNGVFLASPLIDSLVSLKGLTCLYLQRSYISNELLYSIAREGLPLTRLYLQYCHGHSYFGIYSLLSKCQRLQHLDLTDTPFLNDKHVVKLSRFLRDLMSINLSCCYKLTKSALFELARNYPSLSEIKMESIKSEKIKDSPFLRYFGVHCQLKSLFLGENPWLSDEDIIMFASIFPNLQLLDLHWCGFISERICQVLRMCCKIRHLNLAGCSRVKLIRMNFVVPKLEVLNLSRTMVDDETLYVISKNCCGLLQLLLEYCDDVTQKGLKYMVKNCTHLRELNLRDFYLSNSDRNLFSLHGCLLC